MAAGLSRIDFRRMDFRELAAPAAAFQPDANLPEDYDAAARRYLDVLFTAGPSAGFAVDAAAVTPNAGVPDLQYAGLTEIPLVNTAVAEYRQTWRGVPVYGARLGVEMTPSKELVNVSGYVGNPGAIDPVASISPSEARRIVKQIAGLAEHQRPIPDDAPTLMYRYDEPAQRWSLVYCFDNVRVYEDDAPDAPTPYGHHHVRFMNVYRVFIDAHTGEEVARAPQRKPAAVEASGQDADGTEHIFTADQLGPTRFVLEDPVRKIRTLSLRFSDLDCGPLPLPGQPIESAQRRFDHTAAVVAHANATRVYDFFLNVLRRNGIDGKGMWLVSTVDCLAYRGQVFGCLPEDPQQQEWQNAAWIRSDRPGDPAFLRNGFMVYGQTRWPDGQLHSFAESLDVVGHELTHGVTDYTADLEYLVQSGAMNESYSDIFGIAIANAHEADINRWNWELGEELSSNGTPTRDLEDPTRRGQPAHMNNFRRLPPGQQPGRTNDWGFVHHNSGIHNKAAFNLFTEGTFTWQQVVQMFYLTLVTPGRLTPTSSFSDSRAGMISSCTALFPAAPDLAHRLDVVGRAFSGVGIN